MYSPWHPISILNKRFNEKQQLANSLHYYEVYKVIYMSVLSFFQNKGDFRI